MRARAVLIVAVLFAASIVATVSASTPVATRPTDRPGCEGLNVYRIAMIDVGRDFALALREAKLTADRDVTTYSSDDWLTVAGIALDASRGINAITPPEWIQPWHQVKIEQLGLYEQIARAAARDGLLATIVFSDQIDTLDARERQVNTDLAGICGDFRSFVAEWDELPETIDEGTPVASPSP